MRLARMRLVMPRTALILALVGLTLAACARMGGPDGMPRRPATVTVSGVGTVAAVPDLAEITSGVVTQAPTAAQALGSLGIAARDIQTTNISVSPLRRPGKDGQPPEITGYEVSNQVRVKVRDLARLGRVLDQQVGQGANLVYGIRFGLQEPVPRLDEARWPWPTRAARRSCTRRPPGSSSGAWWRCTKRALRRRAPRWRPA
jgi:hypothetical protein